MDKRNQFEKEFKQEKNAHPFSDQEQQKVKQTKAERQKIKKRKCNQ